MLFHNALLAVVAAGAVNAFAISDSNIAAPVPDLIERCDTCSGPGWGVGNSISTIADVDVGLRTFTDLHFDYATAVASVFTDVQVNVQATVQSVIAVGGNVLSWSKADLASLSTSLDAYIAGTVTAGVDIFVKAGIDATTWSVVEATCLKTLISTCISSNINLAVNVKADLFVFVSNSLGVAQCTVVQLKTKVHTCQTSLASVVASLHLDVMTSTCVSAATSIKLALQAYVEGCIHGTAQTGGVLATLVKSTLSKALSLTLSVVLVFINAWVAGDCNSLAGSVLALLGINLSVATDYSICQTIVAFLLNCSSSLNFCSALGLNTSLYLGVFSSISIQ